MRMKFKLQCSLFLAAFLLNFLVVNAQKANWDPNKAALTEKIPVFGSIRTGTLKNGMKYYIRKNVEPQHRAEMRLAVNAGSVLETDDQQGLAHFCEHMAFNGTKNFKKSEVVDYLESIGMKFGADLNAYTSLMKLYICSRFRLINLILLPKAFKSLKTGLTMLVLKTWKLTRSAEW